MTPRRAFTIIELLIIVVIIGLLTAIAIPKFSSIKDVSYVARLRADLRNVAVAQEEYLYENGAYASNAAALSPRFIPSPGTTLTIVQATGSGWSATATSSSTTVICAFFYNVASVAPATQDGQIACQ